MESRVPKHLEPEDARCDSQDLIPQFFDVRPFYADAEAWPGGQVRPP